MHKISRASGHRYISINGVNFSIINDVRRSVHYPLSRESPNTRSRSTRILVGYYRNSKELSSPCEFPRDLLPAIPQGQPPPRRRSRPLLIKSIIARLSSCSGTERGSSQTRRARYLQFAYEGEATFRMPPFSGRGPFSQPVSSRDRGRRRDRTHGDTVRANPISPRDSLRSRETCVLVKRVCARAE